MSTDNFDTLLSFLLNRRPFEVFVVEMHGGKRFEIDHANSVVFRKGKAIFLSPGGTPIYFDHDSVNQIIDAPAHVAAEEIP